jgi:hypothetical protein
MRKKILGRGGRRPGSGRKKKADPIVTYSVDITTEQAEFLRIWGDGDISAGLRWLIEASALFIHFRSDKK